MLVTAPDPARAALERLTAGCAAGLRGGSAVAAGIAAFVGLAPPASLRFVVPAVAGLTAWAAAYAALMLTRGWSAGLVAGDVAVAACLCLGAGRLVPDTVLADGSSWVFLVASTTVIVSQLGPRPLLGVAAIVAVPSAYAAGVLLAGRAGLPGFSLLLAVQGSLVASMVAIVRRSTRAADAAIAEHETVERDAAVRAGRRAEEREHYRLLHDSVSATLTVVSAGGLGGSSPTLRRQARHDLMVIERIQAPVQPPVIGLTPGELAAEVPGDDLARWLAPVAAGVSATLSVDAVITGGPVPDAVGAALAGAVAEGLANVIRHAGVPAARLWAGPASTGVLVELTDEGRGFDPAAVPAHRRGLRESVVARMAAVGGSAAVTSRPGAGTRVTLRWPAELGADRG
jgi:signal transduction histidine kinase